MKANRSKRKLWVPMLLFLVLSGVAMGSMLEAGTNATVVAYVYVQVLTGTVAIARLKFFSAEKDPSVVKNIRLFAFLTIAGGIAFILEQAILRMTGMTGPISLVIVVSSLGLISVGFYIDKWAVKVK